MNTKAQVSGSFDILLGMEDISGRSNVCLSFGSGLFRKLGWSSGDWLKFDASTEGIIALNKIPEPSEASFYARKIKLANGFYQICFYSKLFKFPSTPVYLPKEQAMFNLQTRTLSLHIPQEYQVSTDILLKPVHELQVEDIAAAFKKL